MIAPLLGADTYTVTRRGAATYVNKVPVYGADTTFEITASIQPMTQDELQREAEGLRASHAVRIFTGTDPALRTQEDPDSAPGAVPDVITYRGVEYQIQRRNDWSDGPLKHAEYMAVSAGTGRSPAP